MEYPKDKQLLSKREQEVLNLIFVGLENKAIAKRLFISTKTVEFHKENIKQKLGKNNVKELYNMDYLEIEL
jgi:two-component system, NarL family, response regulator NreC